MAGFFQVPDAFAALDTHVIPSLFEGKSEADTIRVWVAGCSTGEEAYSVAILLFEYASRLPSPPQILIYASDNDPEALFAARRGVYPTSIRGQMSSLCLETYFFPQPDGYIVAPSIRDAVAFSTHDVLIDQAFQTLDLITCRHLLAALDPESQRQIVSFFHHALLPQGFLFLGDAAFASGLPRAFTAVNEAHQIYRHHALTPGSAGDTFFDDILDEETAFPHEIALKPEELAAPEEDGDDTLTRAMQAGVSGTSVTEGDVPARGGTVIRREIEDVFATGPVGGLPDAEPAMEHPPEGDGAVHTPGTGRPRDHKPVSLVLETETSHTEKPSDEPGSQPVPSSNRLFDELAESDGMAGMAEPVSTVPTGTASAEPVSRAPSGGRSLAPEALATLHNTHLMRQFMPPGLLVDEQFNILHQSGALDSLFRVRHHQLERDYLETLPAVYRRRVTKAIQEAFFARDPAKIETVIIPTRDLGNVPLRILYLDDSATNMPVVQLVFGGYALEGGRPSPGLKLGVPEAEPSETAPMAQGIEDALARLILAGPFPMLLHAEGGAILEMNKAWADLAGYPVSETTTLTAWTKRVRGQRIQHADPKLAEQYGRKGVESVSIRTSAGDTRLLALHSVSLGRDRKQRKLTLTMAIDISGHAGQYGVNLVAHGADDAARAKAAFLANVSHEVRTPLTSMIGFSEHLASKLTGQDMQFARYISDSGYRLLETLNAILRAAALEGQSGENELSIELIDITLECQGLLQLFKPQADQYDVPLKMIIKEPVKAYLDRAAFRRIVGNLIGNAIKFTRRGEVTITVSTEGQQVRVEIDDTGIGISDAFKPFLFDRFTQEAKGEGRAYAGCGLGLAVAKRLVDQMNGSIGVESQVGVGSRFTVRLPIGDAESSKTVFGDTHAQPPKVKKRVLVIEDDLDTQELMMLLLRDRYEVTVTSNATEALQKAQQEEYEILLMDLNLGGSRSGFELLSDVRRLDGYQSVPVLAVSALPIDTIRKQLIKSGFNGYIAKPFTRARIYEALENVLGNS